MSEIKIALFVSYIGTFTLVIKFIVTAWKQGEKRAIAGK